MAGHSKWANIKHRKAGQDAKRGKVFTKIIRELTVAAKSGGGNVADNPRLRAIMDKALAANMTRDTIDRAVARGAGTAENENLEELDYEGYGPGGVAILVETNGSVAYLFERTGIISFPEGADEEQIMEIALEAGAHDITTNEDTSVDVLTTLETFGAVQDALKKAGLEWVNAEMTMLASTHAELDLSGAESLLKMIDHMEDLDDVQNVYHNGNISDEIAAQL
jgi:transcriptional/translational regulatory protein YebC/TACO1